MIYRNDYSLLGFGCMRLPSNYEEAEKLILHAIDSGINYYDTAYAYRGNEVLLGKILAANHCRDKVKIATKLPCYMVKTAESIDKIFSTELERLQTDHVDSYLMHMLPDVETWERLKGLGMEKWLAEKKASGQIKQVGFSFHGNTSLFLDVLNAYPWDFCQIQYNYMDEHSQAGKAGLLAAYEKGISVIIMEPLRGGLLVNGLCAEAKEIFSKTGKTPAEWGLNWLYAQKEVSCVLSGMNTMAMLEENIAIASRATSFTEEDFAVIEDVKRAMNASTRISCTACSYCMPCPVGVDIPGAFRCYNVSYADSYKKGLAEYIMCTTLRAKRANAALCIQCGRCEKQCPQHLPIRNNLTLVKKRFETPLYKVIAGVSKGKFKGKEKG